MTSDAYRTGLLCLAVTSIGWGFNWPALRVLLRELPPFLARGTSGIAASLFFVLVALLLGQSLRVPRALRGRLLAAALINVFAWMGFATLALRWLTVAQAALLVYTMPVWTVLFAWPLLGQRPSARSLVGLVVSIAGLCTLFGAGALGFDKAQLLGVALALGGAVLFAFGTIALKPMPEIAPIALLAWQLGLGCLPMVAIGLAFEHPRLADVSATTWALMLYMTAGPMGLCYLTWFAALRRVPPATASVATLMTPVIGIGAAAITLGEPFGMRQVVALVLTLGGVALALKPRGAAAA